MYNYISFVEDYIRVVETELFLDRIEIEEKIEFQRRTQTEFTIKPLNLTKKTTKIYFQFPSGNWIVCSHEIQEQQ